MRISNAERHEIVDVLSKHYAEGRLDSEEFDERSGRVMNAKTRGDVAGVLDDLPNLNPPPPAPPSARRRHTGRWLLAVALFLLLATALTVPPHVHVPWLLIGIVGFVLWCRARRRHYRRVAPRA